MHKQILKNLFFFYLFSFSLLFSEEKYLQNIKQLTFKKMGFEKAGEGYFSPDEQTIIFQAIPHGKNTFQIYTMNLQEQIPKLVSTGFGSCTCANFHPHKNKIIFASSHKSPLLEKETSQQKGKGKKYEWNFTPYMNIFEANVDGSHLTPLSTGSAYHAECSYSIDGKKIVYASNEDGSMNLYQMNSDGSKKEQLTFTKNIYNGGPFFSPDGKKVIYRSDPKKQNYLQIYLLDIETKTSMRLTNNSAVNWAPYFFPDGKVIAYTTSIHGHHQYEIYLLNIETKKEVRLTYNPSFDGLPVFSPSGKKIMWTSKRHGGMSELFIADFTMPKEIYYNN